MGPGSALATLACPGRQWRDGSREDNPADPRKFLILPVGGHSPRSSIGQSITNCMEQAMATKGQDQPGAQLAPILATATFACGAICAVPPTSIVGVLLWIGYLGDAVASRLR